MSGQHPSKGAVLLKAFGAAALLSAARAVSGGSGAPRPDRAGGLSDGAAEKRRDLATYGIGYALALGLTGLAFVVVTWGWAAGTTALGIVFALALLQAIVHFRCFLHIDLRRSHRDDLQLLLFSSLIVCLMVSGTLVVLFNLRMRMM